MSLITDIQEVSFFMDIVYFVLLFSLQCFTFYILKFRLDTSSIVTMLSFLTGSFLFMLISVTNNSSAFFDYGNVFIQSL